MSKDSESWDDLAAGDKTPDPETGQSVQVQVDGIRWSLVAGLILIAAITVLAAQNRQTVGLDFLAWEGRAPLFAIILGTAVVAVAIDEAIGVLWRRRRRKTLAEREELKRLRSERLSD